MGTFLITVLLVFAIVIGLIIMVGGYGVGIHHRLVALRAGIFNFAPASLYEIADPGEREVPKVSFT